MESSTMTNFGKSTWKKRPRSGLRNAPSVDDKKQASIGKKRKFPDDFADGDAVCTMTNFEEFPRKKRSKSELRNASSVDDKQQASIGKKRKFPDNFADGAAVCTVTDFEKFPQKKRSRLGLRNASSVDDKQQALIGKKRKFPDEDLNNFADDAAVCLSKRSKAASTVNGVFEDGDRRQTNGWKSLESPLKKECLAAPEKSVINGGQKRMVAPKPVMQRASSCNSLTSAEKLKLQKQLEKFSRGNIPPQLLQSLPKACLRGHGNDILDVDIERLDAKTFRELQRKLRSFADARTTKSEGIREKQPQILKGDFRKGMNAVTSQQCFLHALKCWDDDKKIVFFDSYDTGSEKSSGIKKFARHSISSKLDSKNTSTGEHKGYSSTDVHGCAIDERHAVQPSPHPSGPTAIPTKEEDKLPCEEPRSIVSKDTRKKQSQKLKGDFHKDVGSEKSSDIKKLARHSIASKLDSKNTTTGTHKGYSSRDANGCAIDERDVVQPSPHLSGSAAIRTKEQDNPPCEEQLSPQALRAEALKKRYAVTILRAKQNKLMDNGVKRPREWQVVEQRQREDRLRIQAKMKAEEAAAQKTAEAERKMQRERDRKAARLEVEKMQMNPDIYENIDIFQDPKNPGYFQPVCLGMPDEMATYKNGVEVKSRLRNPLAQLGLFLKDDDLDDNDDDWTTAGGNDDLEEGELHSP